MKLPRPVGFYLQHAHRDEQYRKRKGFFAELEHELDFARVKRSPPTRLYREDQLKEIFQAAARYEWLMQEGHEWPEEVEFAIECQNKSKIDAAIDAAMEKFQMEGEET